MPGQKLTKQNWIRLVEYFSSDVSDPSEVPRMTFFATTPGFGQQKEIVLNSTACFFSVFA